jgi:alcohol dehydrogenase
MLGFRLPTHVKIQPGCLHDVIPVLQSLNIRRILLLIDPGLKSNGWTDQIQTHLKRTMGACVLYDQIESDPKTETVEALTEMIRADDLAAVVAIGGGSTLDAGKAAAMLASNGGQIIQYEGKNRYKQQPLPFIAVPTTCGTGSEVTWVSVLTHAESQRKISVKGLTMFPTQALVDANLLKSLPPHFVAYTGLDALTHALEATTGNQANPVSDALAEKAISLLFRYLPRAVANISGDSEAREAVMRASTIAGLAFGNADVGAVHCLSETLGALYHIPHGLGNAMLLSPVLSYHKTYIIDRLAQLSRQTWPTDLIGATKPDLAEYFLERVKQLSRTLEIPPFTSLDIKTLDYQKVAEMSVLNGSNDSNPQIMQTENYLEILNSLS